MMTLEELNRYAQIVVSRIPSEDGFFILSDFRASPITIDLHAELTYRHKDDEDGRTARVTLPGWTGGGDKETLAKVDSVICTAYRALLEARTEAGPYELQTKRLSRKVFHIFTLVVTLDWDRRRKTLWQWITRQQCPNELYRPDEDGMPACASPEQREWRRRSTDPADAKKRIAEMPDLSALSDEELASRAKTAKLGEGVIAEVGARKWRKESQR